MLLPKLCIFGDNSSAERPIWVQRCTSSQIPLPYKCTTNRAERKRYRLLMTSDYWCHTLRGIGSVAFLCTYESAARKSTDDAFSAPSYFASWQDTICNDDSCKWPSGLSNNVVPLCVLVFWAIAYPAQRNYRDDVCTRHNGTIARSKRNILQVVARGSPAFAGQVFWRRYWQCPALLSPA